MIRYFQPPMRFWTIATIFAAGASLVVFAWTWTLFPQLRPDILKILLQFLLITIAGGLFLIFLNARRDQDQRDRAREDAVREMVDQIHAAYRKLKMVKRRLRSQMSVQDRGRDMTRNLPYRIPAQAFERAMDDLLAAQIESEQARDRVVARPDLLSRDRIDRIYLALQYATRYFHDVYEDFEDCVVARQQDHYEITADCTGLADFLGRARWKTPPGLPWPETIQAQYEILKDVHLCPEERHHALRAICIMRSKDPDMPRYRLIATQCIGLASTDMRRAQRRRHWHSPFERQ